MALTTVRPQGMGFDTGRRNLIINGAMNVAQRGTSSTGLGATSGYFTVDRFALAFSGTAGRLTMTQTDVTDLPGFTKCIKLDCTTADTSIAAGEFLLLQYKFEGQDLQRLKNATSQAESFTVSFYVKGNAAATYTLEAKDIKNTRNNSQNFSVTTSWNRVSLTFVGDTDTNQSAFDHDNSNEFSLQFWLHAGSTYNGGTFASNTWIDQVQNLRANSNDTSFFDSTDRTLEITGLQMEIGENVSDFEHRSFAEELALCKRYYYQLIGNNIVDNSDATHSHMGQGMNYNAAYVFYTGFPTVEMRATPTLTQATGTDYYAFRRNNAEDLFNGFILGSYITPRAFTLEVNANVSGTAGHAGTIHSNNSAAAVAFDAEL